MSVETWDAAQKALERNLLWSPRNAKHDYLLRGLVTCGLCGHGYIGAARGAVNGTSRPLLYCCIARRHPSALYGHSAYAREMRCTAPYIRADETETVIWSRVERMLRDPGPVLEELAAQMSGTTEQAATIRAKLAEKQQEQGAKQQEKDSVLALFRKGRIDERDLNRQLDDIAREEAELAKAVQALNKQLAGADEDAERLAGAEALLRKHRESLDSEPMTNTLKRRILEQLVRKIVVDVEPDPDDEAPGATRPVVHVTYVFDEGARAGGGIAAGNGMWLQSSISRPPAPHRLPST